MPRAANESPIAPGIRHRPEPVKLQNDKRVALANSGVPSCPQGRQTGNPLSDRARQRRRGSSRTAGRLEEGSDRASGGQHDDPSARTGERGVKRPLPIDGVAGSSEFR
jgi:hypothetical protein